MPSVKWMMHSMTRTTMTTKKQPPSLSFTRSLLYRQHGCHRVVILTPLGQMRTISSANTTSHHQVPLLPPPLPPSLIITATPTATSLLLPSSALHHGLFSAGHLVHSSHSPTTSACAAMDIQEAEARTTMASSQT
jgi:hypothetical protein